MEKTTREGHRFREEDPTACHVASFAPFVASSVEPRVRSVLAPFVAMPFAPSSVSESVRGGHVETEVAMLLVVGGVVDERTTHGTNDMAMPGRRDKRPSTGQTRLGRLPVES